MITPGVVVSVSVTVEVRTTPLAASVSVMVDTMAVAVHCVTTGSEEAARFVQTRFFRAFGDVLIGHFLSGLRMTDRE